MSVTGNGALSLRKKDLVNQKNLAIGFKKTMFAHKATLGETGINLSALVAPPEMVGFVNPTSAELLAAQLFFYHKNLTIISSLRGVLMEYLSYTVTSSNTITFNGFTAADGEIFIGIIDYNAVSNGVQVIDGSALVSSGTLADGVFDFNVGQVFEVNKYSSQQVGAVIVFRNGIQQFRNSNNSTVTLDGNYYEVNNGSGGGSIIHFNNAPVGQSDNILVVSNGLVAYSPDGSALQTIESLAGQLDSLIPTVAALAGVPESNFQTAPNNVDLKSFGDTVLSQGSRITSLETYAPVAFSARGSPSGTPSTAFNGSSVSIITSLGTFGFDTHSGYNTSTGKYTIPVSGKWHITAGVSINGNGLVNYQTTVIISKNGTVVTSSDYYYQTSYNGAATVNVSCDIDLVAGDQIWMSGNFNVASTWSGSGAQNYLSGFRIGN